VGKLRQDTAAADEWRDRAAGLGIADLPLRTRATAAA
jgi:hypothetical protein